MEFPEYLTKKLTDREELGTLATFVPNKFEPIYNWFYYKEGFAKNLVFMLLDMFSPKDDATILDPFCGSGTTLLACKERGYASIGLDLLPVCIFAAATKTATYDTEALREQAKHMLKARYVPQHVNAPPLIKRAFNPHILEDILLFRSHINQVRDETQRNFFLLALIQAAMKVTYAFKDGGVIKIRKKPVPSFRQMLRRTIFHMITDLSHVPLQHVDIQVLQQDARSTDLPDASVDAVITSPPYLNNIDYTKVYEIEEFINKRSELPPMRSYIGLKPADENDTGYDIPLSAVPYIRDMKLFLTEMKRVTKPGALLAIVVGNGYVEQQIVESDLLIAMMAEELGFIVEKIYVLNKRFALEVRSHKKGVLRESIVILKNV
ncbi:MAG: DNA adenine methylase [Candidatus Aenigmarchaeota archaeon]|nr:DNA adenine methylase [Candidatus Aenigmarchaeota archaeon]